MFQENMALLGEVFDKSISAVLMETYWQTLFPFSDPDCQAAFKQIIASKKFFPKPADFLEILQGKPDDDKPSLAWAMVDRAVRRIGPYDSVKFPDPVIHSVIESMGGWVAFQNCSEADWKWKRKDFESLYRVMEKQHEHPKYLPGGVEMHNMCRGLPFDAPIQIESGTANEKPLRLV